jgi:hypothetical protein
MPIGAPWQLKVRIGLDLKNQVEALAKRRRVSISRLVEGLLHRELGEPYASDAVPDEHAVREMTILLAVELSLKLQEANIPGGITLSRQLLDAAADAAIERLEMVDAGLRARPE